MKKSFLIGTTLAGAVLIALAPSSALAICPGFSQPLQHALGGWFENCPDAAPVQGFAYVRGSRSTIHTGTTDIICEDSGLNGQLGNCPVEGASAGDGLITVSTDWGGGPPTGGIIGCPNLSQQAGIGRNVIEIVANDGSTLILTVGYSFDLGMYPIDLAQQDTFPPPPLRCSGGARTDVGEGMSFTSYDGALLCGIAPSQKVYSDCDPGTWGLTGGGLLTPTCVEGEIPPTTAGQLYRQDASCTTPPDMRFGPAWGSPIGTPDAAGSFCVPFAAPATGCAYIANFGTVDGVTTASASGGALSVPGSTAPSARALAVRATKKGSSIEITWRTAAEFNLAGFNVQTDAQGGKSRINVNDALIASKGAVTGAGFEYSVQIPVARFKGGKTVYVESLMNTGQRLLSDPAQF